ncbi:MAG: polysaccharide biosynthesis/export family protein [Bacteroidota bacterium]
MSKTIYILAAILLATATQSCISLKKFTYLQSEESSGSGKSPDFTLRIKPGDILSVQVYTINAEAFPGVAASTERQMVDNRSSYEKGIVVDPQGNIEIPLVGKVMVGGLSIPEAKEAVSVKFQAFMDNPVVVLKKLSFKVTILGEVNKPGLYYIPNEKISMLEGIGMAGDLTYYGNRKNIKLIRQTESGYKEILIDITSKQPLDSEVAWLHPDDVVYVQPIRRRGVVTISPTVAVITSIIATLTLISSLILRETN